nr:hypothetical protein [uncultured Romboutsia sp.]
MLNISIYHKIKNINKTKINYIINIVIMLTIYNISNDYLNIVIEQNIDNPGIFNFLFYILNNYFINAHLTPICILILAYKINKDLKFETYYMYRFNNKVNWFYENIKIIGVKVGLFLINMIVITLIIAIINIIFNPLWSEMIGIKTKYIEFFKDYNYIYILTLKIILKFLYLFTLSVIFISTSSLIKMYDVGILITLIINFINISLFLNPPEILRRFLFLNNVLMSDGTFIIKYYISAIYWILILVFIIDITSKLIKEIDY